jgi:hypothetical protein
MLARYQSIVNSIAPDDHCRASGPLSYNIGCPPVTGTTAPEM